MDALKAEEICRQMNEVRRELGGDVEAIVDSARTLTDWRYYVRKRPWLCLTGAVALGYFLVSSRARIVTPAADLLEEISRRQGLTATPQARSSLAGTVLSLVVGAAARGAAGYLTQFASTWISNAVVGGDDDALSNG